ncbi:hypothetical protein BGX31_003551 [Mortierella sp. GBA43]|nr:hypothetical protein BGX31_003551 [Mortierella sp. GBA43]
MDQIITGASKLRNSGQDKLALVSAVLLLASLSITKADGTSSQVSPTLAWSNGRVRMILNTAMDGWTNSQAPLKAKTCELLAKSFTGHQTLQALGSLASTQIAQSDQVDVFVVFCQNVLRQLSLGREEHDKTAATTQDPAVPQIKDWAFTLWLCDQLRIPSVFVSATLLQDQPSARAVAQAFVKRAAGLLECAGRVLQIQVVDNQFTLHRLVIACAAFTNNKDLWNRLEPSISSKSTAKALENLRIIYQTTPWSISSDPNASTSPLTAHKPDSIMIPGSFSDNVIQIIEKEIRPCFTHVKAQKIANRAQRTIADHQEKMRQSVPLIEDTQDDDDAAISDIVISGTKSLVQPSSKGTLSRQRIQIASVKDTPNDEEERWSALDDGSNPTISSGSPVQKRWDVNFLEAVPVVEWCAKQPIRDASRIHEVFMFLVGPILAMTDSTQARYRVRGLDLLTGFLIQYHDYSDPSSIAKSKRQVDSRIWIKIFERTGLDQVLERALKPLLGPFQLGNNQEPDPATDNALVDKDDMEQVNVAFRAYLTLILVNTEPGDKPTSINTPPLLVTFGPVQTEGADLNRLTIENLFLQGVLGSFKRATRSRDYRTLVLKWAVILVRPVISFDFIWEQISQQGAPLSVVSKTIDTSKVAPSEQKFQGVYGMGRLTIKYLPTLVSYISNTIDFPFPPSPADERRGSLGLAWRAVETLIAIMEVSKPRIPRYRGKILEALANCWANSRVFDPSSGAVKKTSSEQSQEQQDLDQSLISAMQLCTEICQPKIMDQNTPNGLDMDLKVLNELDPSVFAPLFAPQVK